MKLLDILKIYEPSLEPREIKIHLATRNSSEHPFDVHSKGGFEEWQSWQNQKNFERKYVISLIELGGKDEWLFVGVFENNGVTEHPVGAEARYQYTLIKMACFEALEARLIVNYPRTARSAYRLAESIVDDLMIAEFKPQPVNLKKFPGYGWVCIKQWELSAIVDHDDRDWQSALSSVSGVYLVTDTKTDKLYVGSATGEGGIWHRWSQYARGHGDVKAFKALHEEGPDRLGAFQFAILEFGSTGMTVSDIVKREMHWVRVLGARATGLNGNGPLS